MTLGLDSIGDLAGLLENKTGATTPQEVSLELIDEDPNQPRKFFDEAALIELASTIELRGVKTPISLRPGDAPGRFIINHGARRFRASKIAGKMSIPAFIDTDYDEVDQVIENLQRDNLTPREIAEFIDKRLKKGEKKKDIAANIGKSPAYITQHVTLLDLPDPIAEIFNSSRCQDVTVINELVTAYKKDPEEVTEWLSDEGQDINRSTVKLLREFIDSKESMTEISDEPKDDTNTSQKDKKEDAPEKIKKPLLMVTIHGRQAQLLIKRRPSAYGSAWCKYEDDGEEVEADLSQMTLIGIIDG